VVLTNQTVASEDVASPCTAGYKLLAAGDAQKTNLAEVYVNITGQWETGGTAGSAYEYFCTVNSGTLDGGSSPTGAWTSLGFDRTFEVTRSTTGAANANITIQIRRADTMVELDSATIDITATVTT
jgi:hypothetical protein